MRRFHNPSGVAPPGQALILDPTPSHHLLRVTGIAPGEAVEVFDGRGHSVRARLVEARDGRAHLLVDAALPPTASPPATWLMIALVKPAAMDLLLRMATELGVNGILPIQAARSVPKGDRGERWGRILSAAAGQCGRTDLPALSPLRPLQRALQRLPETTLRLVLSPGEAPLQASTAPAVLMIGPEGGWTPAELVLARQAGFQGASLGHTVLRTDTAVAAALAKLRG